MKYMYIASLLFIFIPVSLQDPVLKDGDPKCRYRVHLPTATWHSAYVVCSNSAQELARVGSKADVAFMYDLLGSVDEMVAVEPIKKNYSDIWIGAFMRSSNNESMHLNCKPFRLPVIITDPRTNDEIVCIYFNFTDLQFYTDSCTNKKTFVCENKRKAKANCTMMSVKEELKDEPRYILDRNKPDLNDCDERMCKEKCMELKSCYTSIWNQTTDTCKIYRYLETLPRNENTLSPSAIITHKSFFVFKKREYTESPPQPLSEQCPEMTPELLKEKVDYLKSNLTVKRKETNKFKRTLISAPDERRSAKNIGMVGVVVICLAAGVIVFFDCVNFFRHTTCRRRVKVE